MSQITSEFVSKPNLIYNHKGHKIAPCHTRDCFTLPKKAQYHIQNGSQNSCSNFHLKVLCRV